jgi:phosphatidylglycerophosphatase C
VTTHDSNLRPLAVFDLDGTLVRGECMMPFLVSYTRRHRWSALPGMLADVGLYATGVLSARNAKERAVRRVLGGQCKSRIDEFAVEFCRRWVDKRLHPVGIPLLRRHQELGHRIILLSASPSVYVPAIARHLGVEETVCTCVRFEGDSCVGDIIGDNCKGPAKVERLAEYLADSRWSESYAYGDSPSDAYILSWADHPFLVTRREARPWKAQRPLSRG